MDFTTRFFKSFGLAILDLILIASLCFAGVIFALGQTLLDRDFTVAQVEKLETTELAEYIIRDQVVSQIAFPLYLPVDAFIAGAVSETVSDMDPWLKQQTGIVINSLYDYLEGKTQNFSVVIELEPAKEQLKESISRAVTTSPPPGLTDIPPATIERYLEPFYDRIPSSLVVDEDWLGPSNMVYINTLRQLVSNFHIFFYATIGFILFLIVCIILLNHEVRGSTRSLSVAFLGAGVVSYGSIWLALNTTTALSSLPGVPAYLRSWLPQVMSDIMSTMEPYSYGLAGMGILLLIVSFAYRRQAE
jgi:hypothetical protein